MPFFTKDDKFPQFNLQDSPVLYRFSVFHHPYVCEFIKQLNARGIDGLLRWKLENGTETSVQQENDPNFFRHDYLPNHRVLLLDYPSENVDFSRNGAYSQYNWELFFHAPLLIATRLSANQRFEEAQRWFHYIFEPTDASIQKGTQRFWKVLPFWVTAQSDPKNELQDLLDPQEDAAKQAAADELALEVEAWRLNPFQPHLVARNRHWAYQKSVVMQYLDNLIAWGDQQFRRNTLETINEAMLLYILAADILGPRPVEIPAPVKPQATTFNAIRNKLEDFSDALVQSENLIFGLNMDGQGNGPQPNLPEALKFCIPKNDKLLAYWDTVADRLFKIRHCMNIEGIIQQLPLFEPPIDPALLVRAAAAGVDISSVLSDLFAPLPRYRCSTMLQKAVELCADVKALGAALLSALEKRDGEGLALLRSGQEIDLLTAVREIKKNQAEEAKAALDGLNASRAVIKARYDYYGNLDQISDLEQAYLNAISTSLTYQEIELVSQFLASVLHLIPDSKLGAPTGMGVTFGGINLGSAVDAFASIMRGSASLYGTQGSLSAANANYARRWADWQFQKELAGGKDGTGNSGGELAQIDKQILAATIRLTITQKELENHDKQIENAKTVDEFMRSKFTNQELFDWMVSQTSGIYFQAYELAYDVAKRAEKAFQFERGDSQASLIHFGYWDSLKKGLLAGERLHYDLRRMETAYLEQNKREYEISKHISLVLLDPLALIALKETGQCIVDLPEALFDMDYPGHYMRRIKNMTLTIPCVIGPYTSINCTLTLLKSSIRQKNDTTGSEGNYVRDVNSDDSRFVSNFGATQSIATSHAQSDSGMFELNFRDERYLPFEGSGVISQWRIEMPRENNAFDCETISDVILNLNYTGREGGESLKTAARKEVIAVSPISGIRLYSVKHEFSNEWYRFLHPADKADKQTLQFDLTQERFPFLLRGRKIQIPKVELFLKFKDINDPDTFKQDPKNSTPLGDYAPGNSVVHPLMLTIKPKTGEVPGTLSSLLFGLPHGDFTFNNALLTRVPGQDFWLLEAKAADVGTIAATLRTKDGNHLRPEVIDDIYMICHYSAS